MRGSYISILLAAVVAVASAILFLEERYASHSDVSTLLNELKIDEINDRINLVNQQLILLGKNCEECSDNVKVVYTNLLNAREKLKRDLEVVSGK